MQAEIYDRAIAENYDAQYAQVRNPSQDREFYAELARATGGPVLEIGCGTGRVLLPIAEAGIVCVGLEPSPSMLDQLRAKGVPKTLTLVEGAAADFDLGPSRFRLIFAAFRVFQHLCTVDEQLAALACIRRHLAPDGRLALDFFAPNLARIAQPEEPEQLDITAMEGEVEIRRYTSISRNHATQVMRVRFRHERWRGGTKLSDEISEHNMRWMYRYELEHLLARGGFAPIEFLGGFDRKPYDGQGELIAIARAAT